MVISLNALSESHNSGTAFTRTARVIQSLTYTKEGFGPFAGPSTLDVVYLTFSR